MLVRALIKRVQQAYTVSGRQAVAMKQGRHSPERGRVLAAEDLCQIEAKESLLAPLRTVNENNLAVVEHDEPSRRFRECKHLAGDDLVEIVSFRRAEALSPGFRSGNLFGNEGQGQGVSRDIFGVDSVSYTHLTLPTKRI